MCRIISDIESGRGRGVGVAHAKKKKKKRTRCFERGPTNIITDCQKKKPIPIGGRSVGQSINSFTHYIKILLFVFTEGKTGKEGSVEPTSLPTQPPGPWDNIRLPGSILPSHYDIHLNVDPNKEGFTGHEKINIDAVNETKHVIIHSNLLNITKATVMKKGIGYK